MELIYEWIKQTYEKNFNDQPVFKDLDINLSNNFTFHYDSMHNIILCKKNDNKDYSDILFSKNSIKRINCFVGNNGVGKTTLLKHIFKTDLDNCNNYQYRKTIQIFKHIGRLYLYTNIPNLNMDKTCQNMITKSHIIKMANQSEEEEQYYHFTKIFITDDQYGYLNCHERENGVVKKIAFTPYDISHIQYEFLRIVTNKQESSIIDNSMYYNNTIMKGYRIDYIHNILFFLLKNDAINYQWNNFDFLKQLKFSVAKNFEFCDVYNLYAYCSNLKDERKNLIIENRLDKDGILQLKNEYKIDYNEQRKTLQFIAIYDDLKEYKKEENIIDALKRYLKTEIIFTLLWFGCNEYSSIKGENIDSLLKTIKKNIDNSSDEQILNNKYIYNKERQYYEDAIKNIKEFSKCVETYGKREEIILDFDNNKNQTQIILEFFKNCIEKRELFIFKYLNFSVNLSAGERSFLNIFSYINAIKYLRFISSYSFNNIDQNVMLFLDEPDLSCHPEWQRKMINELIKMGNNVFEGKNVQMMISTHSPILLSDLPRECIIKLSNNKIEEQKENTFGANIFELYHNSFYLDYYIGSFALEKISEIINEIYKLYQNKKNNTLSDENISSQMKVIVDLIGEPLIKNNLKRLINYIEGGNK